MKHLHMLIPFIALLACIPAGGSSFTGEEPTGLLLSGSSLHPDSISSPMNGHIMEESLLARYLTEANPQVILPRDTEGESCYFRIFPVSHPGLQTEYDYTGSYLELVTRLSSDTLTDTTSTDLYFSEYVEGAGYLKGFELFNPREDTICLDHYRIHYARNGSGYTYLYEFPEGVLLPPCGTYAVLNSALSGLDSLQLPAGCQYDAPSSTVVSFNGNDALGLEKTTNGGVSWHLVDVLGYADSTADWTVAGISGASVDHTLMRKSFVRTGNTDWEASAGTNHYDSEWRVYPLNYFENLGYPAWTASPEAAILDFRLPGRTGPVRIVSDSSRVYLSLLPGDPTDSILPEAVISDYAWMQPLQPVWPVPGVLYYTVYAEDRSSQLWEVLLEAAPAETFNTLRELKDSSSQYSLLHFEGEARVTAVHDSLVFIQDSTAGLALFRGEYPPESAGIGDMVTGLSGYLGWYGGIRCLRPDSEYTVLGGQPGTVQAIDLLIQDVLTRPGVYASMLVSLRNVRFSADEGVFEEGAGYTVTQGTDSAACLVSFFDSGLPGTAIPGFATLRGIFLNTVNGLSIAPRMTDDVTGQPDGLQVPGAGELVIVPNPGTGIFTIQDSHGLIGPARISVHSLSGQCVLEEEYTEVQAMSIEINLGQAENGPYLLFMVTRDCIYVSLLIKSE